VRKKIVIIILVIFISSTVSTKFQHSTMEVSEISFTDDEDEMKVTQIFDNYTTGGIHIATGEWWEPLNYFATEGDEDGDGVPYENDIFPNDPGRDGRQIEKINHCPKSFNEKVCVESYLGDQIYSNPSWISESQDTTQAIAVADVDKDGDYDLAVGNWNAPSFILENQNGTFVDKLWSTNELLDCDALEFGDVDGDGWVDLALGLIPTRDASGEFYDNGRTRILKNLGGKFDFNVTLWEEDNSTRTEDLDLGDINGDGLLDFITASQNGILRVYINTPFGLPQYPTWEYRDSGQVEEVELDDFDQDGDLDLSLTRRNSFQEVWQWGSHDTYSAFGIVSHNISVSTPYEPNLNRLWNINEPNADAYRIHFENFTTYNMDDRFEIYNSKGDILQVFYGSMGPFVTRWFEDSAISIHFITSAENEQIGFNISKIEFGVVNVLQSEGFGSSPLFQLGSFDSPWTTFEGKLLNAASTSWVDFDHDGDLDLSIGFRAVDHYYSQCKFLGSVAVFENINNEISKIPLWNSQTCDDVRDHQWYDANQDGFEDLIFGGYVFWNSSSSNEQTSTVKLYLSNGTSLQDTPSWETTTTYPVFMIKAADFDGNGNIDVVIASESYNVLYHRSLKALSQEVNWMDNESNSATIRAGWGDIDNDGDLDLVTSNFASPDQLFLNTGSELQQSPSWSSGDFKRYNSNDGEWTDFNGDGDLDLVVSYADQEIEVYLWENGELSSSPAWTASSVFESTDIAVGDIDDDGDVDILLAVKYDYIYAFFNQGDGTDFTQDYYSSNTYYISKLSILDIDGDGLNDVSACNLLGPDFILFSDSTVYQTELNKYCNTEFWGDVNGDFLIDRIVGNYYFGVDVYINQFGLIPMTPSWSTPHFDTVIDIELLDINYDLSPEIIVAYQSSGLRMYDYSTGFQAHNFSLADLGGSQINGLELTNFSNGVGPDILVSTSATWNGTIVDFEYDGTFVHISPLSNYLEIYSSTNHRFGGPIIKSAAQNGVDLVANFNWGDLDYLYTINVSGMHIIDWESIVDATTLSYSAEFGDIDNDGDLDLLVATRTYEYSKIYENIGGSFSRAPIWESYGGKNSRAAFFSDLDHNGWVDVVLINENSFLDLYYNYNGTIDNTPTWSSDSFWSSKHGAVGDLNNDGWDDIVLVNQQHPVVVYMNDNGSFSEEDKWISNESVWITNCDLGDMDSDGYLDLAIATQSQEGGAYYIEIYRNLGGEFEPSPSWRSSETYVSWGVQWGDLDGDGDLDLAAATSNEDKIFVNSRNSLATEASWSSNESLNSFGVSLADINKDGGLDMLFFATDGPNRLYYSFSDIDLDLIEDRFDTFPLDPTQYNDEDGDGYGDNSDGRYYDHCKYISGQSWRDRRGCLDMDGDGQSDLFDAFMNQPTQWSDIDGDGMGDNYADLSWSNLSNNRSRPGFYVQNAWNPDPYPFDFDNDGFEDAQLSGAGAIEPFDECPIRSGYSYIDRFGCFDADLDGVSDFYDSHTNDPTQFSDADLDGYGDNLSGFNPDECPSLFGNSSKDKMGCIDIDGDGWSIFSDFDDNNPNVWSDSDEDGYTDQLGHLLTDDCPGVAGKSYVYLRGCPDLDVDGIPDSLDDDIDGDNIPNVVEIQLKFDPFNASIKPLDYDNDSIPDSLDFDDDNDGFPDEFEIRRGSDPMDASSDPFRRYFGFPTGFYIGGSEGFTTQYSENGIELSLSGFIGLITSEMIGPLLVIPLTATLFYIRNKKFKILIDRIGNATAEELSEIIDGFENAFEIGKLKAEQLLFARRRADIRRSDLEVEDPEKVDDSDGINYDEELNVNHDESLQVKELVSLDTNSESEEVDDEIDDGDIHESFHESDDGYFYRVNEEGNWDETPYVFVHGEYIAFDFESDEN